MKRVVVTGLGVVSSIGNNAAEVTRSLRDGKSGIEFVPQYKELGFRSQVAGTLKLMNRNGNERLSQEVAREVCLRSTSGYFSCGKRTEANDETVSAKAEPVRNY